MADSGRIIFGIFPKTLLAMTLVAVLPLGATWYFNTRATEARLEGHVNQQLNEVAQGLQGYVDTWVEMNIRMLRQNAVLNAIQSMKASRQNAVLKQITDEYNWNYLAFTVAPDGSNVGRSDGKKTRYYGDRIYVQQVLAGAPRGQQVLIGKTSGKPAFVLSVPVQNGATIAGVLAIAMTIEDLSKRVTQARIGQTGQAFLVDEDGKIIAHQNAEFTKERQDFSGHPAVMAARTRGNTYLDYRAPGGKQMVAAALKTRYGWTLVTEQEGEEAFAAVREANRTALISLAATLTIAVLVSLVLSRKLSVPIQRLTAIADEISHGRLDIEVGYVKRRDEIGALARSIDRLGTSVKLALRRIARFRREATQRN